MLNWGIIGLGEVAYKFASAFKDTKDAKLLAIASKNKQNLNKFKTHFKIDENFCFSNYEELISSDKVDIVYITLPHNFHFECVPCVLYPNS